MMTDLKNKINFNDEIYNCSFIKNNLSVGNIANLNNYLYLCVLYIERIIFDLSLATYPLNVEAPKMFQMWER